MSVVANVPLSALEYRANFRDPILARWHQNGEVVAAVFRAFRPWNITLNRVTSTPNPENLGQLQINFEVVPQRFVFAVNVGAAILSVWNPNWQEAAMIRDIAESGTAAMVASTGAEIESRQATLSLHLTPQDRSVRELTEKFASRDIPGARGADVQAYGFSIYRATSSVVVDLSFQYPESLFVRLTRTFSKDTPMEEIEEALRKDQDEVLSAIGLRLSS